MDNDKIKQRIKELEAARRTFVAQNADVVIAAQNAIAAYNNELTGYSSVLKELTALLEQPKTD